MKTDLASALGRALEHVRASNPQEATRAIQAALAGKPLDGEVSTPGSRSPAATRRHVRLIDSGMEDAEVVSDEEEGDGGLSGSFTFGRSKHQRRAAPPRRSLREAVEGLSRGRPQGLAAQLPAGVSLPGISGTSAAPAVPEGARYEWRSHKSHAGSRDYRLYVPSSLPDGPQGLIVMLHGCTQDPDDFASGTGMNDLAEQHGLIVAYPSQTRAHNVQACWNWFRPGDQRRGAGEPAILAGIVRELMAELDIDRSRVFAAGLSAGGAMAAVLGESYPDVFAAIGIHSGLPTGCASDVVSAFAAMRGDSAGIAPREANAAATVRAIVFHGTADTTVHPSNASRIVEAAQSGRNRSAVQLERGASRGGRSYTRALTRDAKGTPMTEHWLIEGAGHAWSGGASVGSYTDPTGPDASAEMVRFFLSDQRAR